VEERVIHEVRFIETEDGFRVEVKGDKERIRRWCGHPGFGPGFGPGHHIRHKMRQHGFRGHGPWHYGAWGWWWDEEDEPDEVADKPVDEAPPAE